MKKFLFAIICAVLSFSANADLLIPAKLFAEKSKDTAKESVFSWTNSDKYTCDAPVTLFFENFDEAEKVLDQCLGKEGWGGGFPDRIRIDQTGRRFEIYGRRYKEPELSEIIAFFPDKIKLCPKDKPLLDNYGVCHSCDDDEPIDVSWMVGTYFNIREFKGRIKYFCSTICPNRHIEEERIKTESTTEDNYFCVKEGWMPERIERIKRRRRI